MINLSMDQFSDLLTCGLKAMSFQGSIHWPTKRQGVLTIFTGQSPSQGHCDVSRATMEDIINELKEPYMFQEIKQYIEQCVDIAMLSALEKTYRSVVVPYKDEGGGI